MSIPMIDLPFLAQLLVALFVVATLDGPPPVEPAQELPPREPEPPEPLPGGWSAETDLHAQRLLRLEKRRDTVASQP
ncbi:hypothetical protein VB738_12985 [Cyanobium gracile UHCC 0139]|uniref:Uncharacterized protein n=1 Tax=Cyanobium gracile UHCC 0139 TaxID=3110308 RepID=A0ABU5RWU1_9CYAN|nr:hypothetical protein [Cyanobium gracile]MEA5392173.1 hypothetical protein [Cyanobium gracile UHCC 0139]